MSWDGRWLLLVLRVPEQRRELRHRLTTQLAWAGFGSLGGGLWITPHVDREGQVRAEEPAQLLTFRAELGALGDTARVIDEAWDLDNLREHYDQFIEDFTGLEPEDDARRVRRPDRARARLAAVPVHRPGPPGRPAARRLAAPRAPTPCSRPATDWAPGRQRHFDDLGDEPSRKRIYVAYAGGTIGMKPTGRRLRAGHRAPDRAGPRPAPAPHRRGARSCRSASTSRCWTRPTPGPSDWLRIARDIAQHRHHYDGFVVLHGTDTMAYTASALAFLLRGLGKPVVVTGSQIPLGVLRSDGRQNLLTAVLVAARDDVREVCLVFGSSILRGSRAVKASASGFEAFTSPNLSPLGMAGVQIEVDPSRLRDQEPGAVGPAADARRAGEPAAPVSRHAGLAAAGRARRTHPRR